MSISACLFGRGVGYKIFSGDYSDDQGASMTYKSPFTGTKFEDIRREAQEKSNVPKPDARLDRYQPDLRPVPDRREYAIKPDEPGRRTPEA